MKVKICGLTREEDALFAAECGADFLGFIFVEDSPRFVDADHVAQIADAVRGRSNPPKIVGVFRNASHERMRDVAARSTLDLIQLHGTERDDDIPALGIPAIKTLHVGAALPDTSAHANASWLLFDTYNDRLAGGMGKRFDWSLLTQFERAKPFFLSGGITPENAAVAISTVRPDAIDLASGVESSPGVKDHAKIAQLFERVKR
ncbi:MAG TPA: phosphoribosylanthranilate isomerase [Thermoanaerobaculia bacterium]|jgi:phosphoribosylanthranilate isomerase